jgi:hypothetical protein
LWQLGRQLLDTATIGDESIEPCLGDIRQEEAFKHVVAGDVEGTGLIDFDDVAV